jgi:hypothetical protein
MIDLQVIIARAEGNIDDFRSRGPKRGRFFILDSQVTEVLMLALFY